MPIHVLPPDVAAKIAAGEVIERPVSVAKELLENALDADATDIRIEIAQGGRRLVRVSDNGCGIPADQVELAFARHATSKLRTAEELYTIRTLGFRGEALASIAAVSRLTLSTRAADEAVGTVLRLEGGEIVHREPQGRPQGTVVQVENLFYNTPARLKFLRSDTTEASHIARLATSYALAYPEKRITLQNNDRLVLRSTGTGHLLDVLLAVYGLDVVESMMEVGEVPEDETAPAGRGEGIRVWGYTSAPDMHRAGRRDLTLLVNRRWIQDNALAYAITEAYRTLLPQGRFPLAVIHIEMPPEDVDVNIHPTKREVRFRHEREVFAAVQRAVRATLLSQHPVPSMHVSSGPAASSAQGHAATWSPHHPTPEQARLGLEFQRPADRPPLDILRRAPETADRPTERLPMLRVVGQVAQTYIIAEGPGGMYLIDQHAAHERIRYEALSTQLAAIDVATQELMDPLPVELSPRQATLLEDHLDVLTSFGFDIAPFGGNTFMVKSVPNNLVGEDIGAALAEIVDAAIEGQRSAGFSWREQALITLSCHTAVRAGQTLSHEEMRDLVRQLERATLPHTCPHGRPTIIHLSQAQLEKEFRRR
ncbi:MAG: DNA mismatch repair endonuclease MutL [Anaerolineae bacterium]|jgi:DNA mismatch repair protein MutL